MNKNIQIGVVVLGTLILIAYWSQDTPSSINQEQTPEVSNTTIPAEIVADIPLYPNAAVIRAAETSRDTERIFYASTLETTASIQEINEWYRDALSNNGWSIKSDKNIGGYQLIQGEKEGFYTSMQAANGEGGKVTISQQTRVRNN